MNNVILHAFNWKYSEIIEKIDEISASGYGAILLPPILYSDSQGTAWWQRYQPKDYRVLYSHLGNKQQIDEIIKKCHECNPPLQVYTDMVINHMAYENREDNFNFPGKAELENYKQNKPLFEENKLYGNLENGLFSPHDFNRRGNIVNWANRTEVIYHRLSDLPDLSDNDWVLSQHRKLFKTLVEMGFDGFRIDAVKHISLKQLNNITSQDFMKGKFLFGEILTVTRIDEELFMKPFLSQTQVSAYDFPLYRTLRKAFSFGGTLSSLLDPEQQGNALPWNRSVTFTTNHDLPLNDCFRALMLSKQDEHLANAFILGRDGGLPLIFSDHNESAGDFPEDKNRWANSFNRHDIVQMIKFHNFTHGSEMISLYENENVLVFRRGNNGIVAINKSDENQYPKFNTFGLKKEGNYIDLLHNNSFELKPDNFELFIPPRTAQMWLNAH